MPVVNLNHIKLALCRCIDEYIESYSDCVDLDEDLFWLVLDDQLFKIENAPKELGVGSLIDSLKDIEQKLKSGDRLGAVEMQHLAGILNWLSAKAGAGDLGQIAK